VNDLKPRLTLIKPSISAFFRVDWLVFDRQHRDASTFLVRFGSRSVNFVMPFAPVRRSEAQHTQVDQLMIGEDAGVPSR
jgi:hypothetical protein